MPRGSEILALVIEKIWQLSQFWDATVRKLSYISSPAENGYGRKERQAARPQKQQDPVIPGAEDFRSLDEALQASTLTAEEASAAKRKGLISAHRLSVASTASTASSYAGPLGTESDKLPKDRESNGTTITSHDINNANPSGATDIKDYYQLLKLSYEDEFPPVALVPLAPPARPEIER